MSFDEAVQLLEKIKRNIKPEDFLLSASSGELKPDEYSDLMASLETCIAIIDGRVK